MLLRCATVRYPSTEQPKYSNCTVTCQSEFMAITHDAVIHSTNSITINHLLNTTPHDGMREDLTVEHRKDPELEQLLCFLK